MRRFLIASCIVFLAGTPLAACKPKTGAGADAAAAASASFMADNAKKPGIVPLPSGVQYQIVKSGPAGSKGPGPHDEVKVHYEGKLTNGTVFDSSFERGVPT